MMKRPAAHKVYLVINYAVRSSQNNLRMKVAPFGLAVEVNVFFFVGHVLFCKCQEGSMRERTYKRNSASQDNRSELLRGTELSWNKAYAHSRIQTFSGTHLS